MVSRSFAEKALRAVPLLGFVVGEALDDARECQEAIQQREDDLYDLLDEVKQYKGSYIAVIDEKKNVSLQGRVHRIRKHAISIDIRKPEEKGDGTLGPPLGHPKPGMELKIWVPQPGEDFVVLYDEEEDDGD